MGLAVTVRLEGARRRRSSTRLWWTGRVGMECADPPKIKLTHWGHWRGRAQREKGEL